MPNETFILLDRLKEVLDRERLQLVWWITGEKMAINTTFNEKGPRLPFLQGLYWLEKGRAVGWTDVEFDEEFREGRVRTYPPAFGLKEVFRTLSRDNGGRVEAHQ